MSIFMNDKKIEIFAGARVRDVLLKYSQEKYQDALCGKTIVIDKNKNQVDLDGEVSEGQRLYTSDTGK